MSKLLKAVAKRHRPAIHAKMTTENGYDEAKHTTTTKLHKGGIIDKTEKADLDGCFDDLAGSGSHAGAVLSAANKAKGDTSFLNDDGFVNALMAMDGNDDDDGDDLSVDDDDKITA